ncbi:hypothetical protein AJ80_07492 [Polytolypa hystricis UAMH7299]|uniref:ABM domain-containing protein n=1 Tax=Polytolypa hystricis (strain UAMH7299) TaxID=1447883 RepID=A0A2B7XN16_POLH7|nr:hypothetical protein AJ80_07492 [Polytolypa hystricis UAMH7299]
MLEPAIPEHLVQERTRPGKTQPNFEPPFPAYSARFPKCTKDIVMAVIGAQYASAADNDGLAISKLTGFIKDGPDAATHPFFWELASVTDTREAYNIAVIAYWLSKESYKAWSTGSGF